MKVLLAHAVTSSNRSTSTIQKESLRPPQIHSHYKRIHYSISYLSTLQSTINLYLQTVHSNLSSFSTSRCPSMMVSIAEIVLYTKPAAQQQYLLRLPCHPLHTKRAFPFSLGPENTRYKFLQRDVQSRSPQPGDTMCSHTLTQPTHPEVSL